MSAPANVGRFWVVVQGTQRIYAHHDENDARRMAERLAQTTDKAVTLVDTHVAVAERVYRRLSA